MTAFNTFKNAKSLSKEGLREEGFNILKRTVTNIGREGVSGLGNISIPKQSGNGGTASTTSTVGGTVNTTSALYQDKILQAAAKNSSNGPVGSNQSSLQAERNS